MEGQATYPGNANAINYAQQNLRTATVAPKAVNPSCFGNVEDVCGLSGSAANRVERVVNRLCGHPPPSPDSAGQIAAEPDGLFDAADRQARDIRGNLERIFAAVDRLEKSLP